MSFEEIVPHLASEVTDPTIECLVVDYSMKKDKHGRDILVLKVRCRKWGTVYLTYSPSYMRRLAESAAKLGIRRVNDLVGRCFSFEKEQIPIRVPGYSPPYPRFMLRDQISCSSIQLPETE